MHHIHLWCCSYLSQQCPEWVHPWPVLWDVGTTHRQERSWKLCGALVTHYVKQWCTIPSQKLSVVFHTLLISTPHSRQPDTRETSHSKLKGPSEEFKTVLPCSPDKTGGRRSSWHRHCWTAASSDRHVMGPSHKRLGRRAVCSPRCELLPQKTDFTLLGGFLAACAEACCQEQRGAWAGAGSRPFPGLACQACSSQTAPHPQHRALMALPPHVCNKHVSPHRDVCLQTSQVAFKYGTWKHNPQQPS